MKTYERNIQEIGKSLLVTLPKEWTKSLRLEKGSKIKMMVSESEKLVIAPEFVSKTEAKETTIPYDEFFARRFFKEYFAGNETISILIKDKKDTSKLHEFIKKFMNVQVIEENKNKVVIKCFKIEDLSIEDCLRRVHFLSLDMMGEILESKNRKKTSEIESSLTRFYMMLVMQIRRFLEEGKYAKENQISLIRAMDCRMVAEKIERIADIVKDIKKTDSLLLSEVKKLYSEAFSHFFNNDLEKSLRFFVREKELNKKLSRNRDLQNILKYTREISMLTK